MYYFAKGFVCTLSYSTAIYLLTKLAQEAETQREL